MKILIVDDSQTMRNIHKNTLIEHSVKEDCLLEADNGDSALALAKDENISLFFIDWNMPGLNGLELVKEIREMDKYTETPIIMITSEAAKYNVIEAIDAGVTNYIVKPIQGNTLWEKISKYVKV
jgi:two-component system, chemotaxis family, chemotaxis protein CheY